eukprot:RCo021664
MSMQIFQKMGSYAALVHTNALLHREAVDTVCREVTSRFPQSEAAPLKVLDLACGGEPLSVAAALARLSPAQFEYTGVDLCADQVQKARGFRFPANVVRAEVLQGSAWVLGPVLPKGEQYDIVFCGLNTHHGTPEENYFLATELRRVLRAGGVFINHDVFRSPEYPHYERKPDTGRNGESFAAVPSELLGSVSIPDLKVDELNPCDPSHKNFRDLLVPRFEAALREKGLFPEDVAKLVDHVSQRDFPLSYDEMARIYSAVGFSSAPFRYDDSSAEPLRDVYSVFVAWLAA